jgi:hypothetical protein
MGVESTNPGQSFKSIFKSTSGGGGGGGGAPAPPGFAEFTVDQFNTSGVPLSTTPYSNITSVPATLYSYSNAGFYRLTIPADSEPITFDMWAWGGGGGVGGGPGPGNGGAGGGVRGRKEFIGPTTITFLVSQNGGSNGIGGWTDGGTTPPSYVEGGGGGSSRIADSFVPFPTINTPSTSYILIGGGGGGGSSYSTSGTLGASGGYPSGNPGGGYYPADGGVFGKGGTQSAGGAATASGRQGTGSAGGKYSGGAANGGGGGGGYYGGSGAGGYYAMGGGGSGFIEPGLTNTASFSASPGTPTHYLAVDDPANPGTKPATAGDTGVAGFVAFKINAIGGI